jgi:hypothetical protein
MRSAKYVAQKTKALNSATTATVYDPLYLQNMQRGAHFSNSPQVPYFFGGDSRFKKNRCRLSL